MVSHLNSKQKHFQQQQYAFNINRVQQIRFIDLYRSYIILYLDKIMEKLLKCFQKYHILNCICLFILNEFNKDKMGLKSNEETKIDEIEFIDYNYVKVNFDSTSEILSIITVLYGYVFLNSCILLSDQFIQNKLIFLFDITKSFLIKLIK
ncbi:unnamed protein product [Paramecium octaurelia]|uniref:Uncharacterized protein n=1 Tax=Paramecium octaurelia TaxID=43137 RepID=A0A8S1TVP2_PAROT|nr:unnamed protein product [Paramecium octaurelia]